MDLTSDTGFIQVYFLHNYVRDRKYSRMTDNSKGKPKSTKVIAKVIPVVSFNAKITVNRIQNDAITVWKVLPHLNHLRYDLLATERPICIRRF